jgi:hypothetical protein
MALSKLYGVLVFAIIFTQGSGGHRESADPRPPLQPDQVTLPAITVRFEDRVHLFRVDISGEKGNFLRGSFWPLDMTLDLLRAISCSSFVSSVIKHDYAGFMNYMYWVWKVLLLLL